MIIPPNPDIQSGRAKRDFLRIAVNMRAKITLPDKKVKGVTITDLSSTGISFDLASGEEVPSSITVEFRLGRFSKLIKAGIYTKNVVENNGKKIYGCSFEEMAEPNKKRIASYIRKKLDALVYTWLPIDAAFLCSIDAVVRLFAFVLLVYYSGTVLGKDAGGIVNPLYGLILAAYSAFSFGSLIFLSEATRSSSIGMLKAALAMLMGAAIYMAAKSFVFVSSGLFFSSIHIFKAILGWQIGLAFLAIFSAVRCTRNIEKIRIIHDTVVSHRKGSEKALKGDIIPERV